MTFAEGPCVQAALADTVVRTDDFRDETRWPQYAPAVSEIGVLSGLSFKLYTSDRTAGALNLFGFQPNAWTAEDETVGSVWPPTPPPPSSPSLEQQHLHAALLSRDRIGQAKGIIMERFNVDAVRAFQMLRQLSQEGDVKLVELRRTGHRHVRLARRGGPPRTGRGGPDSPAATTRRRWSNRSTARRRDG